MDDVAMDLADIVADYDRLPVESSGGSPSESGLPKTAHPFRRVAAVALIAAAVIFAIVFVADRLHRRASSPFQNMRIERLTHDGNIISAEISPDAKFVAYIARDGTDRSSLFLRQIATGADVRLVGPSVPALAQATFTRDGSYVYYMQSEGGFYWSLYRIPAIGGTPAKVVFDVDSPSTFSPDGSTMAFVRGIPERHEVAVMIAGSDGSNIRQLAAIPDRVGSFPPAWSPDGRYLIVPGSSESGGTHHDLYLCNVATGAREKFGNRWRAVRGAAWLPDGTATILVAKDSDKARWQIWAQPYPAGTPRKITNDLNDYVSVSAAADGKTLAAVELNTTSRVVCASELQETTMALTPEWRDVPLSDLNVSRDGRIVYQASRGPQTDLWIIDRAGAEPRRLTSDGVSSTPRITADGSRVFMTRRVRGVPHVWSIDSDGVNARQLTSGIGEILAAAAPDATWLVYYTGPGGAEAWKWMASGTTKLCDRCARLAASPDARWIAYDNWVAGTDRRTRRLFVISAAGGAPRLDVPWPSGSLIGWSGDGAALTYAVSTKGVMNLVLQPLDGSAPRQITQYRTGAFSSYAWLLDGRLVLARFAQSRDAVLVTNFR